MHKLFRSSALHTSKLLSTRVPCAPTAHTYVKLIKSKKPVRKLASPKKPKFNTSLTEEDDDSIHDFLEAELSGEIKAEEEEESIPDDAKQSINEFQKLKITTSLAKNVVLKLGFKEPTIIQKNVIPLALKKHNIIASAETGTGKTAAYGFPILQRIIPKRNYELKNGINRREPLALIIAPTKELGEQVAQHLTSYSTEAIRTGVIIGGVGKAYQLQLLKNGLDILVATPGRLLELLKTNTGEFDDDEKTNTSGFLLDLSQIEFFVVDECDKMLNMGFVADLREIFTYLPRPVKKKETTKDPLFDDDLDLEKLAVLMTRQTGNFKNTQVMMFSATLTRGVEDLMLRFAPVHKLVNLNADMQVAGNIKHVQYHVSSLLKKYNLLKYLIKRKGWKGKQVLVFARTRQKADRLAERLQEHGIHAFSIHKGKSVAVRAKAIKDFKKYPENLEKEKLLQEGDKKPNLIQVLISTDVLARGIDVENLPFVVNYDVPSQPEDYVHRVGRTGRAGNAGMAVSIVNMSPQVITIGHQPVELNELHFMNTIERFIKQRVEHRKIPGTWTDPDLGKLTDTKAGNLPSLIDKMMIESRQRGLEILQKKQETVKKQMQHVKNSVQDNSSQNLKTLKNMSESYYRLKQRAGQMGTNMNDLVQRATTRKDKKVLDNLPTLRNFKEGRYEDVVSGFEKHRALSRGAIKEQTKWKSGRKTKHYKII